LKEVAQEVGDAFSHALSDDQAISGQPPRSGSPAPRSGQSSATRAEGSVGNNQSRPTGPANPGSKRGSQ
jgi:hypothetical protein